MMLRPRGAKGSVGLEFVTQQDLGPGEAGSLEKVNWSQLARMTGDRGWAMELRLPGSVGGTW